MVINRDGHAQYSEGQDMILESIDIDSADKHLIIGTPEFWRHITPERAVEVANREGITTQGSDADSYAGSNHQWWKGTGSFSDCFRY